MVRVELYVKNKCVFEKLSETDRIYSRKGMRYLFLNLIARKNVPLVFFWLLTLKMVRVELYVQNKCIFEKLSENRPHLQPKGNEVLIP